MDGDYEHKKKQKFPFLSDEHIYSNMMINPFVFFHHSNRLYHIYFFPFSSSSYHINSLIFTSLNWNVSSSSSSSSSSSISLYVILSCAEMRIFHTSHLTQNTLFFSPHFTFYHLLKCSSFMGEMICMMVKREVLFIYFRSSFRSLHMNVFVVITWNFPWVFRLFLMILYSFFRENWGKVNCLCMLSTRNIIKLNFLETKLLFYSIQITRWNININFSLILV